MKLEDIAGFGYFFTDNQGKVINGFVGNVTNLKYGELMGNKAAVAQRQNKVFKLLNQKDVGYVNHLDALAAARFMLTTGGTGIFKHTGVCGAAYGFGLLAEEYAAASEVDEVARFGGIIGATFVTKESAEEMVGKKGQKKQDVVVSLGYEKGAAEILMAAKIPPLVYELTDKNFDISGIDIQEGLDGVVLQERIAPVGAADLHKVIGEFDITEKVAKDVIFGFKVADTRHSNVICYVLPTDQGAIAVGIGGGASDRITASYQAMEKAVAYFLMKHLKVPRDLLPDSIEVKLYMASDGFFPDTGALAVATPSEIEVIKGRIADHPYMTQREEFLAKNKEVKELLEQERWNIPQKFNYVAKRLHISVPLVLNPGGSKKDEAVVQYAANNGMTMLITEREGRHLRCFKHSPQSAYRVK